LRFVANERGEQTHDWGTLCCFISCLLDEILSV
jgi:hypothetical protein